MTDVIPWGKKWGGKRRGWEGQYNNIKLLWGREKGISALSQWQLCDLRGTDLWRSCSFWFCWRPIYPVSDSRLRRWLWSATCANGSDLCPQLLIPRNIVHLFAFLFSCTWEKWPYWKRDSCVPISKSYTTLKQSPMPTKVINCFRHYS